MALGVLLLSLVVVILDGAIINVALPSIARTLHSAPADTIWTVSSYQLAVIIALFPSGALGEAYGGRRMYLIGIGLFTAASALCALAGNLPLLIAARFLQGLGGGVVMALATMMLRFSCPQRMLGTIIGLMATAVAISSAAGPGIAGAILAVGPWPWLFAVNLPIGLLVLLAGRFLPQASGHQRPLDATVMALNTAAFVLFFVGADRLVGRPQLGAPLVLASLVCFYYLIRRESRREAPLVPVDLFRSHAFRIAVMASAACFAGQMTALVALPFYLQHQLNMSTVAAGLYMMPWPLAVAAVAPFSGRMADRMPTAWLCAGGAVLLATGLGIVALGALGHALATLLIGTVLAGIGFGVFQTPNNRTLLLSSPKARSGAAGATQGTTRLTGQTIGAITMSVIFGIATPDIAPRAGLIVAAGFAGLSCAISLWRAQHEAALSASLARGAIGMGHKPQIRPFNETES